MQHASCEFCIWLSLLGMASTAIAQAQPDGQRPHIFCFVADDFGVADSHVYGHPLVSTPHIDRLAAEGMRFTRAFAGSPTCAPSRSILYTGLMSARTGAHPNHWPVREGVRSIGHRLRELGYHVAVVNKVHVKPATVFPFETVRASRRQQGGGGSTLDVDAWETWLEGQLKRAPKTPLCVFLCDNNTHLVWPETKHARRDLIEVPPYLPQTEATKDSLARYYREVELLDDRVGECFAVLKKHGLAERSLFLFTADQGPAWLHGKWNLYDLGLHVPLIARWPGVIQPGSRNPALVSLVDVTPTFVEIAGGKPPAELDGRSFLACLQGKPSHRARLFATHTGDGKMNNYPHRAIRTSDFKLIWNLRSDLQVTTHLTQAAGLDRKSLWQSWQRQRAGSPQVARAMDAYQVRPEWELYDLRVDPQELQNLADSQQHEAVLARLRGELVQWMDAQGDRRRDMVSFLTEKE